MRLFASCSIDWIRGWLTLVAVASEAPAADAGPPLDSAASSSLSSEEELVPEPFGESHAAGGTAGAVSAVGAEPPVSAGRVTAAGLASCRSHCTIWST